MTGRRRAWLAWAPAVLWATLIFVLSAQPALPSPGGIDDKQAHAFTYGVLAVLCLGGLTRVRLYDVSARVIAVAFVLAVIYGVTDEVHQAFVPGRTPDVADVVADAVGALLALIGAWGSAILLRGRSIVAPSTAAGVPPHGLPPHDGRRIPE